MTINVPDVTVNDTDRSSAARVDGIVSIIQRQYTIAQDKSRKLYFYNSGVFYPDGEDLIKFAYMRILEQLDIANTWRSNKAEEIIKLFRIKSHEIPETPTMEHINVLNGMVEVPTGNILEHSPNFLSTIQLPIEYDPTRSCPNWDRFIEEVFPPDAQMVPYELIAWLMVPCTSIQKVILLYGSGANGKSIFLEALRAFLGPDHISAIPLHSLEEDRFATARLVGKLANICADLPDLRLRTTGILKVLTGFDPVRIEEKFHSSYDAILPARLLFSANSLPRTNDNSEGFYRRMIIIPMERIFQDVPGMKHKILNKLTDPHELSGVFNKALEVLPKVLSEGITISGRMHEIQDSYRELTDPMMKWVTQETVEGYTIWSPTYDLYLSYETYMKGLDLMPIGRNSFGVALRKLRPNIQRIQKRISVDGEPTEPVWGFRGIGLITGSFHKG